MAVHAIQPTFAGGVFAPGVRSRVDLQKYNSGLRTGTNIFIHPQGGASNRPGLKYIAEVEDSSKDTILVPFEFSSTQAYMLEFGENYIRFYRNGGQIDTATPSAWVTSTAYVVGDFVLQSGTNYYCLEAHTSGTFATDLAANKWRAQDAYQIVTTYSESELRDLRFAQSGDVLYIVHSAHAPAELTRTDHNVWTLTDQDIVGGPFRAVPDTKPQFEVQIAQNATISAWATSTAYVVGDRVDEASVNYTCITAHTSGTFSSDVALGYWVPVLEPDGGTLVIDSDTSLWESDDVGSLWKFIHPSMEYTSTDSITSASLFTGVVLCGSSFRFIVTGTWTGSLTVQVSIDGGTNWRSVYTTFGQNVDLTGGTGEEQCLVRVGSNLSGFQTSGTASFTGTADIVIGSNGRIEWETIARMATFTSATRATFTLLNEIHGGAIDEDSNAVFEYAEGSLSTKRGWPRVVAFFQDRLCYGANKDEPQNVWMSKTSKYGDFGRSRPLVDSDGITIRLPSRKVNIIRQLIPLQALIAITSDDTWGIASPNGTVLAPTTVEAQPQGLIGASTVDAAVIGSRVIFAQPQGKVMRDIGFNVDVDGFSGDNISIISQHLFQDTTVRQMAYAREPDSLLWVVLSDGVMLSLTYLPEQEVLAWTKHETRSGDTFESVAVIPGSAYDETWVISKRSVNGATVRYVEQMYQRLANTDPRDQVFLDSALSLDTEVTITGVTAADPGVVTATGHPFSDGDEVDLSDFVGGMTGLNGRRIVVANSAANTFELTDLDGDNIDTSSETAYSSGGVAREAVGSVSGLDHLEGETVTILADGNTHATKVVASGSITLDRNSSRVHVGLPYTADLETLDLEVPLQDGVLAGRQVKIVDVVVRMVNSRGMKIGPSDASTLDDLTFRETETIGTEMSLRTGDAIQTFQGGYERFARILIRQSEPLPMTIIALIPRIEIGGK